MTPQKIFSSIGMSHEFHWRLFCSVQSYQQPSTCRKWLRLMAHCLV